MLIDAHTHLDRYEGELESALEEIIQHKIFTLSNSMDVSSYERNLELARRCYLVLPIFGIHPWNAPEYVENLEDLTGYIRQSRMLGEVGLDYFFVKDSSQYPAQRKVLEFFLAEAKRQNKSVNLHTKGAEKEILQLLKQYDIKRAIIHWYSGPMDIFKKLLDVGAYFTVGVEVLYSEDIQTITENLPVEKLLTETDNPGGAKWLTGKIGMPSLIKEVVKKLAELKNTTPKGIIETVQANFLRSIRDDPWLKDTYNKVAEERFNHI
ncbi:MAG: TatD family hydrolase [candidate division Zixibacteria bacterium]|nr:TatD family hydrolase [candidate division Zixibacteria bacterium]